MGTEVACGAEQGTHRQSGTLHTTNAIDRAATGSVRSVDVSVNGVTSNLLAHASDLEKNEAAVYSELMVLQRGCLSSRKMSQP